MADEIGVVLAEDQGMVLGAFTRLLDLQPDMSVLASVTSGESALQAVAEHTPDILVCDIEMPGMSGLDVAEELLRRDSATRVLIVTTFARSGYLRRAMDAGVRGYVLKDSPIDELADALRRVHAGERVVAPDLAVAAWDQPNPLSRREGELLRHVTGGASNAEIAQALHLTDGTVRNYLSSAIAKLGARNRTDAARTARDRGWL